jgi:maleamate amidohydrolase
MTALSPKPWEQLLSDEDKRVLEIYGHDNCSGVGERPAMLVIDMSYAFLGESSEPIVEAAKKRRTACGERGWAVVDRLARLLDAVRAKGAPVIYTTGGERPDLERFGARAIKALKRSSDATRSNLHDPYDIVEEIAPGPLDIVVRKQKPSAFFSTPLINYLVAMRVDSLFVAGVATSGCVRASVVDAFSNNYPCALIEDCCFDRFEASHAMTLFDLGAKYAEIVDAERAMARIAALPDGLFSD